MGIENITEKILAVANDDARRIFEKGRYDGRATIYRTERQIKQQQVDMEQKAQSDAETVKKRKNSVAELEARKMRLAAKQEAISLCFAEAMRALAELPEDQYVELLAGAIEEAGVEGGELLLTERDQKRLGEKLVNRVNSGGKAGTLVLADDIIKAAGGFVLRKGAVEMNSTLEVMVEAVREKVTPEVVETLFGERK